jgi:hypothetical protein
VSETILIVMLASWACCLWLGFQIGRGRSEQRSKHEFEDFERRFKIVNGEAVEVHDA